MLLLWKHSFAQFYTVRLNFIYSFLLSTLFSVTTTTYSKISSCTCLIEKCDKIGEIKELLEQEYVRTKKKAEFHVSDFCSCENVKPHTREVKRCLCAGGYTPLSVCWLCSSCFPLG